MMPFLAGGEIVTIRNVSSSSLKRGDLLFFKNAHGQPVLHRIVKKTRVDNVFIFHTKGDARYEVDEAVPDSSVLGKACKIERLHMDFRREINLESLFWVGINYLAAVRSLTGLRLRSAVLKLRAR
jgi:signal peptidase I